MRHVAVRVVDAGRVGFVLLVDEAVVVVHDGAVVRPAVPAEYVSTDEAYDERKDDARRHGNCQRLCAVDWKFARWCVRFGSWNDNRDVKWRLSMDQVSGNRYEWIEMCKWKSQLAIFSQQLQNDRKIIKSSNILIIVENAVKRTKICQNYLKNVKILKMIAE